MFSGNGTNFTQFPHTMNGFQTTTPLDTNNMQMTGFSIPTGNGLQTSTVLMPNGQSTTTAQSAEYMRLQFNYIMLQ